MLVVLVGRPLLHRARQVKRLSQNVPPINSNADSAQTHRRMDVSYDTRTDKHDDTIDDGRRLRGVIYVEDGQGRER